MHTLRWSHAMNPLLRTWPHPAAPVQSQRCPESPNLLTNREKQEALLLGMPFEIAEIAGGQSCDFTSLLVILTNWVLLRSSKHSLSCISFSSLPSSSRCLTEKMQRVSVGNAFRPSECMKYCDHPLAFGLEPAGFSSQWAALPTNSLIKGPDNPTCYQLL